MLSKIHKFGRRYYLKNVFTFYRYIYQYNEYDYKKNMNDENSLVT